MTLERYFKINGKKNIIDFSLRAQVAGGIVTFYVRPDSKDGDTRDYYVFGNELIPTAEFDKRKAECGEKLIQRFLEIKERKNNSMGTAECPPRQVETLVRQLPSDEEIEELVEIINHTSTSIDYRNKKIHEWLARQSA